MSRFSAAGVSVRFGGRGEERIGALLGASDAAAQLIELRQAEHVGAMDDQRVGGRDIEAGFDDGGRQQHVELAVVEAAHDVFELGRRHAAMRHAELDLGNMVAQEVGLFLEIGDARADIKALAAAIMLAQQRLADDDGIEGRDIGPHRQAVERRRGDERKLAHARQRQLQGARDGRRGQRQHMHIGAQLLEPLLVLDAEMLLLIDDEEAEIAEFDILGEERMGADDDVDVALCEPLPSPPQSPCARRGARLARVAAAGPGNAA